jgi:hypothetical protein
MAGRTGTLHDKFHLCFKDPPFDFRRVASGFSWLAVLSADAGEQTANIYFLDS